MQQQDHLISIPTTLTSNAVIGTDLGNRGSRSCSMKGITGFGCTGSAMGSLFYRQLGLHPGGSVVPPSDAKVGPFTNVQPYLYWACTGETAASPCQASGPANGFEWNFSFGNGFQGTNLMANNLFVIVYYPDVPPDNQRLNRNLLFPPFATNASIVRAQIPWTDH